ncbi:NAD(+)/NADH kinase [Agromyces archimandritae]|uniref:NAD kinase n=1 Tax=Agromyces archimandritae TaxID=2781962 RepID=A0A975FKY4_9MICO|nr:NAD(+)/NADH kinase [Agromyces archimandritae]QTX03358.1 NAD(+)/NADH kinase [Agromyces archimandritae]
MTKTIGLVLHPTKSVEDSLEVLRAFGPRAGVRLIARERDAARTGTGIDVVADDAFRDEVTSIVALGGDGTMLGAMRDVADRPVPVLGVNYGNLGFLVEVEPRDLPAALGRLVDGDVQLEPHHALELGLRGRADAAPRSFLAFNDLAIARRPGVSSVSADFSVDGTAFGYYRADAIVIATAAGSTAYNHAAGGPILSPAVEAIVVTPVAPMSGIDRAVVFGAHEHPHLAIADRTADAALEVDGQVLAELSAGDELDIRLRRDAGMVIRLDAGRHARKGRIKLSLLDLPVRQDQLLELIPSDLRIHRPAK